jgi:phage terminase large subunit
MLQNLNRKQKIEYIELLEEKTRREKRTVIGIVCPVDGHTHSVTLLKGKWVLTNKEPNAYLAAKLEPILKSFKRYVIVIGGRGSSKSVGVADITLFDAMDNGAKTYCLREYQSSIKNSVHSLLKDEISRLEFEGFDTQQNTIKYKDVEAFEFAGLARNVDSIKSAHGFKRFVIEEAQFISQDSLDTLTPTARKKPQKGLPTKIRQEEDVSNVSMVFIANPHSSADPFSQRFIVPFQDELDEHGFYEDDLHLIVVMNYEDNPWFEQSGLEEERQYDYKNKERNLYDHIWLGKHNDSVDNSIIKAEWFDACIDAHKLPHLAEAFKPHGVKIASHDPADGGKDAKSFTMRHGSIITHVKEYKAGEIDEGCDWATGLAINLGANIFRWDGDGMGAGLKRQVSDAFAGTQITYEMFRGGLSGSAQHRAEDIYTPVQDDSNKTPTTYADTFLNNRSQSYISLADRCYNTYKCVIKGEYIDPDEMISFDSSGIDNMGAFKSEICRIPRIPNPKGLMQIMGKQNMKKLGIKSPNMSDGVMMTMPFPVLEAPQARDLNFS